MQLIRGRGSPAIWLGLLLLLVSLGLAAPQLRSATEMVRARNALSLGPDVSEADLAWAPDARPADYLGERVAPAAYFIDLVRQLHLDEAGSDWARALAISHHLLGSASRLNGGAIQSDLRHTHERITLHGDGYCGDFVRVFTAIANAAGMSVRPWAFSFDGYGGHGHVWVEIWDRERAAWVLVDVFQNYYYTLDTPVPLSALELRAALSTKDARLQLHRLDDRVPPGWAVEAKARDYLARGLPEWYVPWGNDVHTIDQAPAVRAAAGLSRALEGVAALAAGVQPEVRLLAARDNAAPREALRGVRQRLVWSAGLGLAALSILLWPARRRDATHGAAADGGWPAVGVVGPLPPPPGGMANQCEQLVRLLRNDGARVEIVRTNAPYRPAIVGRVPFVRAVFRLLPFLWRLWRAAGRNQVLHVLANSGWAWHLIAAPALWIGRLRGTPIVVNYRGGLADEFLSRAPRHVHRSLRGAAVRVTPSDFLRRVFAGHGLDAEVIPNIVDLDRFQVRVPRDFGDAPHIVVARNLEPIYGLGTAIDAFARLRRDYPLARLTIAGAGPQQAELQARAAALGLADAVHFPGSVPHREMPALYASADVALNPSTVDNMPNSVLEAYASHLPLVSTDAGGVPDIVDDGRSGLLVPVGDAPAMAQALRRVLSDRELARRLVEAGELRVQTFAWPVVRTMWLRAYRRAIGGAA
ncbi:MAG TPA: glycosyltransferase [Rubrivivax sp.]|nr:glycosyltransferase [Rubrivivax sp.]